MPPYRSDFRLTGTAGDLFVNRAYGMKGEMTGVLTVQGKSEELRFAADDQFGAELTYFSRCVLENREPQPSGAEGLADLRVQAAIRRSLTVREGGAGGRSPAATAAGAIATDQAAAHARAGVDQSQSPIRPVRMRASPLLETFGYRTVLLFDATRFMLVPTIGREILPTWFSTAGLAPSAVGEEFLARFGPTR